DRSRLAGGGSGGAAAAVAAGIVPGALASDAGGSARLPAASCGVVAIAPTYGRVSRYGLVSLVASLERVAALGLTVADAARLLEVIAGHDPYDSTSADLPFPRLLPADTTLPEPVVVGVPEECFPPSLDPGTAAACGSALRALERLGAELRPVSLPAATRALAAHRVPAAAEASSGLARIDGIRFGAGGSGARSADELYRRTRARFGPAVRETIVLGALALSGDGGDGLHARALRARDLVTDDFRRVFRSGVDVLFTPT